MTESQQEEVTEAMAIVDEATYKARITQASDSAFVEVWGDGYDADVKVPSTNVKLEMRRVLRGSSTLPRYVTAVLGQAARIFVLSGKWGPNMPEQRDGW